MYDLIDECGKDLNKFQYDIKDFQNGEIRVSFLAIKNENEEKISGFSKGQYFIIEAPNLYTQSFKNDVFIIDKIKSALRKIIKYHSINLNSRFLIVGLGNPEIIADCLGNEVFSNINVDVFDNNNNIFKFCPNIFFETGIDTTQIVKMFVENMNIDCVIVIDSLATSSIQRLGTSFQLTSSGLSPGSGVRKQQQKIDYKTMKVPCISIGVPFLIFANILDKDAPENLLLSLKDIQMNIEKTGFIIAKAIEEVLL